MSDENLKIKKTLALAFENHRKKVVNKMAIFRQIFCSFTGEISIHRFFEIFTFAFFFLNRF